MNPLLPFTLVLAIVVVILIALLLKSRREHRQMLYGLPTGLCVVNEQGLVQRWNHRMVQLSGIDSREALGRNLDTLPAPWATAFANALPDHQEHVTKQALDDDGSDRKRWVVLHASPVDAANRRTILVDEITDYQHMQDELLHKERLASIGRLAAGVAHEIGNPVTGIACIAQNLADGPDPAELEQGTSEILKQTERITRTVSSLMQLSHPGSAARTAECVPCNLADCIDEAIHLLTLDREGPEVQFENHCDRESLVSADNQFLLQVMLNLLDNARAAAGEGPVTLNAREDGGSVTLTIDNPGPVLESDVIGQVFEPFFTTKDVGEGTGLGLPLVRRMLDDMGGTISLLSPIPDGAGEGTRAQLTLAAASYGADFAGGP